MYRTTIVLFLLCLTFSLTGQLIGIESSIPPGTDWRKMESDTVSLVYPKGLEKQAQRIGGMVHYMAENNNLSIGDNVKKIEIFLLNKTVVSNGYVATPPFHSKFYIQAPQISFAGTTDWLDLLAIHEYRHVQQMNNALHGATKWLYYAFGEMLWAGAAHLAAPAWFWEGDAVVQETLLSHSGRGTIPAFHINLKTIADQKDLFPYEKMVSGSYKDFIPNHYYLGYAMSMYGRSSYGNDFWNDVYKDAVSYRGIIWPFSEAIKAKTGLRTRQMYKLMMEDYKKEHSDNTIPHDHVFMGIKGLPTMYSFPKYKNDSTIIVQKEDFKREAWFMEIISGGDEKRLLPVGYGMGTFDVNENHLVWNEIQSHPRWSDVSYSNIYIYDFITDQTKKLTDKTKYFAPAISPDGHRLLVMESDEKMNNYLVILDIETSQIISRIQSPENAFITYPVWIDENEIAWVAQKHNLQSLVKMNLLNRKTEILIEPQYRLIENVQVKNSKLYYLTNKTNHQNQLVCIDLINGEKKSSELHIEEYLVEMPAISGGGEIAYISTSFNQKKLVIVKEEDFFTFARSLSTAGELDKLYMEGKSDYSLVKLARDEGGKLPESFDFNVEEERYKPGIGQLKLHSWIVNPAIPNLSLMLQSNDRLGTIGMYVEPGYNLNEGAFFTNVNLSYGALYTKFDLGLNTMLNRSVSTTVLDSIRDFRWNEFVAQGRMSLPHSYTRRNSYFRYNPTVGYKYIQTSGYPDLGNPAFHAAFGTFSFAWVKRSAYRSIKPRLGISGDMSLQKVMNNEDKAVFDSRVLVYLPGLTPTNSTYFDLQFRYQDMNNEYYFPNNFYYTSRFGQNISTDWRGSARVHYAFPIWYPDIAIGPFAFFKRVRMDLNYEMRMFPGPENNAFDYMNHVGFYLISDARYLRLFDVPVGFGLGMDFKDGEIKGFDFNVIVSDSVLF